jgi:hypothetical protein
VKDCENLVAQCLITEVLGQLYLCQVTVNVNGIAKVILQVKSDKWTALYLHAELYMAMDS